MAPEIVMCGKGYGSADQCHIQRHENVHFTDDGSIALANQVVSILLAHL